MHVETGDFVEGQQITYAIDIVNLTKSFTPVKARQQGYTTFKDFILAPLRSMRRVKPEEVVTNPSQRKALDSLTLRVPTGASCGIIGKNGAGKSTLLKLIHGIYKPDYGSVAVRGRVAALIELGAGFHPDFTGRENVFLGGVMYGLTRNQIRERFQDIVSFAELEDVIDQPVRTYSSGMFMRLGFSLAVHTDPDILMVDEVLAVGDAAFVVKCKEKLAELRKQGKTFLLVTHDLDAVERWCNEVVWLNDGEVMDRGSPRRVIDHYRQFIERGEEADLRQQDEAFAIAETTLESESETPEVQESLEEPTRTERWGSREIELLNADILDAKGLSRRVFHPEESMRITFAYQVNDSEQIDYSHVVFGVQIKRTDGIVILGTNTHIEGIEYSCAQRAGAVTIEIPRIGLLDSGYVLDIAVHAEDGYPYDYHEGALSFAVRDVQGRVGTAFPKMTWSFT